MTTIKCGIIIYICFRLIECGKWKVPSDRGRPLVMVTLVTLTNVNVTFLALL